MKTKAEVNGQHQARLEKGLSADNYAAWTQLGGNIDPITK